MLTAVIIMILLKQGHQEDTEQVIKNHKCYRYVIRIADLIYFPSVTISEFHGMTFLCQSSVRVNKVRF